MPSAANAKSEKPASSEATDNSPIRQIITIIEHKIRNLEKRKSKLTQYRDLQKAGKELNGDQRVAVAKYDEVAQTLEFARDLFKQVTSVAISAEREAKKQAKKEAWVRYAAETNKIREVLLILDVLMQMGTNEARDDFLGGNNGAAKLTEDDLKILDDLYPEVTPKHELNEEGQPGFHAQTIKAAEHLYAIIDGKPKEVLGTTYSRIKEIVVAVHECGYFDRSADAVPVPDENCVASQPEPEPEVEEPAPAPAPVPVQASMPAPAPAPAVYAPAALPVPPAPAVVPAPAYPLRPLPPITLQEVEHAYFAQQYPQQRPIAEVIGSQNFFFLQESEIDSPAGTPQPPPLATQPSPPGPIPTQTFTNQHFIHGAPMPPQPHFPPHPDHAAFAAGVPLPPPHGPVPPHGPPLPNAHPIPPPPAVALPVPVLAAQPSPPEEHPSVSPAEDKIDDDWKETRSPEREDGSDRKTQGQGDGQGRFRRFGRGGGGSGGGRGAPNGHRAPRTGGFQGRQGGDGYRTRHAGDYQNRSNKDGYQPRHYDRYQNRNNEDGYYGNGDTGDAHRDHNGNGGRDRDRYSDNYQGGGFKGRGRGGRGGGTRPAPPPTSSSSSAASRPPRTHQYNRKQENVE